MKTSHQLARQLLEMPDAKIVGLCVGQGASEGNNEFLTSVFAAPIGYIKEPEGEMRVWFSFGESEPQESTQCVRRFRDSGWLTDA